MWKNWELLTIIQGVYIFPFLFLLPVTIFLLVEHSDWAMVIALSAKNYTRFGEVFWPYESFHTLNYKANNSDVNMARSKRLQSTEIIIIQNSSFLHLLAVLFLSEVAFSGHSVFLHVSRCFHAPTGGPWVPDQPLSAPSEDWPVPPLYHWDPR